MTKSYCDVCGEPAVSRRLEFEVRPVDDENKIAAIFADVAMVYGGAGTAKCHGKPDLCRPHLHAAMVTLAEALCREAGYATVKPS